MTIHKTAELEGHNLNAAVAQALGMTTRIKAWGDGRPVFMAYNAPFVCGPSDDEFGYEFEPSTRWDHGGPLIARERINLTCCYMDKPAAWSAEMEFVSGGIMGFWKGPTPLIAAMRAFVASKLGDEVELP